MPRIFDNIDQQLLPAFKETLNLSNRADFCVGYFNLRGWKQIDARIEEWTGGTESCCRLLVGMQKLPKDTLREALSLVKRPDGIDNATAIHLKKQLAEEFREQLMVGVPSDADEKGLRRLAEQIRARKVVVKLFLRHPLHAKLYLLFRPDPVSPIVGYLGSSNLTLAGLSQQGELNVDVVDHDAGRPGRVLLFSVALRVSLRGGRLSSVDSAFLSPRESQFPLRVQRTNQMLSSDYSFVCNKPHLSD